MSVFLLPSARWSVRSVPHPAVHRPAVSRIHENYGSAGTRSRGSHPSLSIFCTWQHQTIRATLKSRALDSDTEDRCVTDTSDDKRPTDKDESLVGDSGVGLATSQASNPTPGVSVATGRTLLCGVTVLWGVYGVLLRFIYSNPGAPLASVLTLVRKVISVAFFLLALSSTTSNQPTSATSDADLDSKSVLHSNLDSDSDSDSDLVAISTNESSNEDAGKGKGVWRAALELGMWSFLGTALQAQGLQSTSATRAAFEIQTSNIVVPLLAALGGEEVGGRTWGAALGALVGVGILGSGTGGGAPAAADSPFVPLSLMGDVEVLGAAICYGVTSVRLGVHSRRHSPLLLTSAQMTVALMMSAVWTGSDLWTIHQNGGDLLSAWSGWQNGSVLLAVGFSAVGCGAMAAWGQAVGQRVVKAAEAQVLYSLQPVWAATFAALFLGEEIAPVGYVGGAIVLLATYFAGNKRTQV